MRNFLFVLALATSPALAVDTLFIPPHCTVTSWCVQSSTSCAFMRMLHPTGLFQGEAQYSVVRSGTMSCDLGYGRSEEKAFQGPVEPVVFRSDVETSAEAAQTGAEKLCASYREQWLAAAPSCQ